MYFGLIGCVEMYVYGNMHFLFFFYCMVFFVGDNCMCCFEGLICSVYV